MGIREPLAGVIFFPARQQAHEMAGVDDVGAKAFAALFQNSPDLGRRRRR